MRPTRVLVVVSILLALGTVGWAMENATEPTRVAGRFLTAVRSGDCRTAAALTTIPVANSCEPTVFGLPARLDAVHLGWGTSGWSGISDQASVQLSVPNSPHAWNLHVQRTGDRWLVDAVAVSGAGQGSG